MTSSRPSTSCGGDDVDEDVENAEKMRLLKIALEKQVGVTRRAIGGLGIDNHLLGLKMLAEEEGCDDVFKVRFLA